MKRAQSAVRYGKRFLAVVLVTALGAAAASCQGSDSGTTNPPSPTTTTITLPVGDTLQNVFVPANQQTQIVFTHAIPPTSISSWKPNLASTISHVQVSAAPPASPREAFALLRALTTETVSLSVRVAPAAQRSTVCTSGVLYGPFTVSLTSAFLPSSVTPANPEADSQTLAIMNAGAYALCVQILSPVAVTFSLDGWVVDVVQDCAAATATFSGNWSGTYTCTDTCTSQPFGGDISLSVTQDGSGRATYTDDGGTTFSGMVCGGDFRFVHNRADETERGSMAFTGTGKATKTSTWLHSTLLCGGVCTDTLTRQ